MRNLLFPLSLVAALMAAPGQSHGATTTTQYTPTKGKTCVTVSTQRETGDTVKRCPGIAGYSLLIIDSDDRASISIVTDKKTTLPLDFWEIVTPTFSTLGPQVAWKLESIRGRSKPVAMVVRVNTVDQADVAAPRPISFIVVARIGIDTACVIGKIPAERANAEQAAQALVNARDQECLPQIR